MRNTDDHVSGAVWAAILIALSIDLYFFSIIMALEHLGVSFMGEFNDFFFDDGGKLIVIVGNLFVGLKILFSYCLNGRLEALCSQVESSGVNEIWWNRATLAFLVMSCILFMIVTYLYF
ncbi:hypothetical protein [Pleionea sp. CnH1-48]|uniref:hypothetical protein n=1 Tax=Pleionea sp. CnH1-48 TaxID=2954494 RepID=UPI002097EFAD|nr:hypothetical protein [Pleionea sp. CnH1-48]MCO7224805.1 hypothetical protein [Pleionea sp. CnH1-48]